MQLKSSGMTPTCLIFKARQASATIVEWWPSERAGKCSPVVRARPPIIAIGIARKKIGSYVTRRIVLSTKRCPKTISDWLTCASKCFLSCAWILAKMPVASRRMTTSCTIAFRKCGLKQHTYVPIDAERGYWMIPMPVNALR